MKNLTQRHEETETQSEYVTVRFRMWMVDSVWLIVLGIYILAGTGLATFHGDEAMQITMSADYETTFQAGEPGSLAVHSPYTVDSPELLRLINGSVNLYTIGLSWHVAGMNVSDLPNIWQWPLSYEDNVAQGNRPSDALLNVARLPSALFLTLSAAVMFGIGWRLGGRPLAYIVSGLYAVNPVILLNGRRAMQEGSFLFFGLLTVLIAIFISHRQTEREANGRNASKVVAWIGLVLAGGLALASKHSGIVFVAGAFGWIFLAEMARLFTSHPTHSAPASSETSQEKFASLDPSPQPPPRIRRGGEITDTIRMLFAFSLKQIACGLLVVAVFVALSPALWNDPVARLGDLVNEREKLLESQVVANPDAPTTVAQRVIGIVTQPFMLPAQHYEAAFWGGSAVVRNEVARYMASPLSGIQFGLLIGLPLTLLAGWGMLKAARGQVISRGQSWGLLAWLAVTVASLLVNPLPWQRYYLPLLPAATILAGIGLLQAIQIVQKRLQSKSPLVPRRNVPQTNK